MTHRLFMTEDDDPEVYDAMVRMAKRENDALRSKVLQSARDTLTLETLAAENDNLRRLLEARQRSPRPATLAEILFQGRDPFSRKVVIDKGTGAEIAELGRRLNHVTADLAKQEERWLELQSQIEAITAEG